MYLLWCGGTADREMGRQVTAQSRETLVARDDAGSSEPRPARRAPGAARGLTAALTALQAGPVVILVLLVVRAQRAVRRLPTLENVGNVLKQSAVICVLALGQLLVIVTRGIDLSVGSNLSLSAVVGALVWRDQGSATLAVLAALATGTAVGLVNGLLYVKGRLPHPFIPTLAMLTAASGLALYLSDSETIQGAPPIVDEIGAGRIAAIPGGGDGRLVPDRHARRGRRGARGHGADPRRWCGAAGSTRSAATPRRPCATASPCRPC